MALRASIVGAAETHVGKVREHNEDAMLFDLDGGVFVVCDGMGGHAAGEVASAMAIATIRSAWTTEVVTKAADAWADNGAPEARKTLLGIVREGVVAAHDAIIAEGVRDSSKAGMGTTMVGAMVIGANAVFAHAGDSRAYIVRDSIAMQLTEDHTLLSRLLAAGIEVDTSGEGSRFRSMLTNALGIGEECRVATFVVPLADGDRFLLCSDGISEYVSEAEVGEVLSKSPSPARAAQRLIEMALDRGGGDNATAIVIRVLEAGDAPHPAEERKKYDAATESCGLYAKVNPQQRLRALRIAIERDHAADQRVPAHALGDRVAWIVIEGEVIVNGEVVGPGGLLYPESLLGNSQPPDRDSLGVARTEVHALALRADDFREVCDEDPELGELLLDALSTILAERIGRVEADALLGRATTASDIPVQHTQPMATIPSPPSPASPPPIPAAARKRVDDAVPEAVADNSSEPTAPREIPITNEPAKPKRSKSVTDGWGSDE